MSVVVVIGLIGQRTQGSGVPLLFSRFIADRYVIRCSVLSLGLESLVLRKYDLSFARTGNEVFLYDRDRRFC